MSSYWYSEKHGVWLVISRNFQPVFCVQGCDRRIARVENQGQTRILDRKPLLVHIIAMDIDWSWNLFSSHNFCSSSSRLLLEKWEVSQYHSWWLFWVADCSKSFKSKIEARPNSVQSMQVSEWFSEVASSLQPIWQQILVAVDSESCQTSLPKLLCTAIWTSEVDVLFSWNLSRRPLLMVH